MSSQQDSSSTQPKSQPPKSSDLSSAEGNEELFENLLITLRISTYHRYDFDISYKWHLQHHENIKKIITGLNLLGESFERLGIEGFSLNVSEDTDLKLKAQEIAKSLHTHNEEPKPFRSNSSASLQESSDINKLLLSSNSLHSAVIAFFKKSFVSNAEQERFEKELQEALKNTVLVGTLREESFDMILPTITSWFNHVSTFKYGLVFLREGMRLFPQVFEKQANIVTFLK
ncbi:hypothetical protein C9374_000186 [Naegleria lovaniensis]|uniref:Uncharacterized protein n=1 Tax=Naegleria lovaniensis TaxID=51637 RepID=A0AA88GTS8_NAELO|nr:uncharacterized protein C9374_000186 [Naegleria lovaniensis]KAG2388747.1 hypothetical protein C9374_000186 [Naegleria lovaniensis]